MIHLRHFGNIRRALLSTCAQNNYFNLLGVPESFHIDSSELANRFKDLQREWHPDKFGNRTVNEKHNAADMSATLNEAYSVLRAPWKRAKHLLAIRSATDEAEIIDATALPPDFLEWVVEFREKVANAGGNREMLCQLSEKLEGAMSQCLLSLNESFEGNNIHSAALETAKLQYLNRMERAIEDVS